MIDDKGYLDALSEMERKNGVMGKIDEDIDLLNLSIFSDLDIENIQDDRNREMALRSKLKRLRKKYFEKIERIHALDDQILLTKEFAELKNNDYLTDLLSTVDRLPQSNNTDLNPEEERLMQTIKDENQLLLFERNKKLSENMNQVSPKKNIILKPKSFYLSFRRAMITFIYFFVPFSKDLHYLSIQGNSTLIILFQVLRLTIIFSVISVLIFAYLIISHFLSNTASLQAQGKYHFPLVILYSSHSLAESGAYSITIGVWIVFMFFCGIIYFLVTLTELQENQQFVKKESIVSQYLFTSWNFNVDNDKSAEVHREEIAEKFKDYLLEEKHRLNIKAQKATCSSHCAVRFLMRLLSWGLFVILLIAFTLILLFIFFLRSTLKDKAVNKEAIVIMDIIPDIILYLLVPIFLIFIPFVARFLPRMEMFPSPSIRNKHVIIKYFIAHCWGTISLIGVQAYFNLHNKTISDLLGSALALTGFETFGCSGAYSINLNAAEMANYTPLPVFAYSQCREDDTGINFLFFSIAYLIVLLLKDLFEYLFFSCCRKMRYQPYENLVAVFTLIVLLCVTAFFIPIAIVLIPLIALLMFKYQLFKLKKTKGHNNIYNSINQRNKAIEMLFTFLFCLLWLVGSCLFFFLSRFPHLNLSICMSDGTVNVLFYSDTLQCGPVISLGKISDMMTGLIYATPFIGDLYRFFSEPTMIIIVLSALICAFVYWSFNGGAYRNFTIKRQNELVSSLHLTIDHLVKRDIITSILLKMSKKKTR